MCVLVQLKRRTWELVKCVAGVTKQCFAPSCLSLHARTHPLSPSQALILSASPQARRGVRVGSICLCDGHWCQAPQGLEGKERRLLSGRVTDVSELSCGTLNGAETEVEVGKRRQGAEGDG